MHIIAILLIFIVLVVLTIRIIASIRKKLFPEYLNFFIGFSIWTIIVFATNNSEFTFFIESLLLMLSWLLFDYFISKKNKSNTQTTNHLIISNQNFLHFIFTVGLAVLYYLFCKIYDYEFFPTKIVLILLSVQPLLNKFLFDFIIKKQNLAENALILPKIRTFIFSSDNIISKNKYKLINFKNQTHLSKDTVLQTAYLLAKHWDKHLAKTLSNEIKTNVSEKRFQTVKKSTAGIHAKDKEGIDYYLGEFSFVKNFIKHNDATHYLVQDNVLAAGFTIRELFHFEGIRLAKEFNEYGNVVLLSSKTSAQEYDKLPFDKIYFNKTKVQQKELIKNLTQKAPTALITQNKDLSNIASFDFIIENDTHLSSVASLFLSAKNFHRHLKVILMIFLSIQLLFATVALIFINQPLYVLMLNLLFSALFIIFVKYQKKHAANKV